MDIGEPASVVLSTSTRAVLRALAGTTQPLTGRDVARVSSLSQNGAHKVLVQLVEHGLVQAEPAGRALLYTLRRQHLLVEPLLEILNARERLVARLATAVREWQVAPVHVSVFGSAARGDGGVSSDIDVLVVRPDGIDMDHPGWRQQLDAVGAVVHEWTGNRLSWLEFGTEEVSDAISGGEAIVAEWRRDSIALAGEPVDELLREARR
ncbi:MAG: helix-turn-helix domain-containing protein [Nocardioidaceae bacterium]|nr:helix-turn-helix domain-containing protein [Nocardioidaceae bacterium]